MQTLVQYVNCYSMLVDDDASMFVIGIQNLPCCFQQVRADVCLIILTDLSASSTSKYIQMFTCSFQICRVYVLRS